MRMDYTSYTLLLVVGVFMAALVAVKLFFGFNIDSDWFWFLAGIGLVMEGLVSFGKQKRFDRKYRVVHRE